jgi:actin-like ATPase involved in cell morphogenesis
VPLIQYRYLPYWWWFYVERITKNFSKTDLPVYIAEDPLRAVVRGTGMALKNLSKFKSILIK